MKKFIFSLSLFVIMTLPVFVVHAVDDAGGGGAGADNGNLICRIFPFISTTHFFGISSICGNVQAETVGANVKSTISLVTSLIFIVIILFAVFVIVSAAIKYIRSEGDDTKIQEAQKAIKSVFVGIAALFVGIIGIIIVLAFFNAGGALEQEDTNTINNPLLNSIIN